MIQGISKSRPLTLMLAGIIFTLLAFFGLNSGEALATNAKHTQHKTVQAQDEQQELWVGTIYTSKFKCGFCFSKNGKARGVLLLRAPFGQVDVYHLYGTYKNGIVDVRHSSGHHVRSKVVDGEKVKGKIRLGDGRKVSFKGKRVFGAPLDPSDCAPLEGF